MFTFLFSLLSNQDVHVQVTGQEAEFVSMLKQHRSVYAEQLV